MKSYLVTYSQLDSKQSNNLRFAYNLFESYTSSSDKLLVFVELKMLKSYSVKLVLVVIAHPHENNNAKVLLIYSTSFR